MYGYWDFFFFYLLTICTAIKASPGASINECRASGDIALRLEHNVYIELIPSCSIINIQQRES